MVKELESQPETGRRRPHYIAATFYVLLAIGCLVVGADGKPASFLGAALLGAYAAYLYRGGRFVIFFW